MHLRAVKEFNLPDRKIRVGDTFDIPDREAKALIMTRMATAADRPLLTLPKRKYQRRDMQAILED